ncbi:hypothetical protein, partial [Neisseria gonorrhoeae]|uniref:hypothetical protein n=1 Tax=Neisseria gonorrhoeae TaxID=485 RepID=UPI0027D9B134
IIRNGTPHRIGTVRLCRRPLPLLRPLPGLLFFLLFLHLPKIPGRRLKQTHRKPSEQIKSKISKNPSPIKRLKLRTNKNRNPGPINKQQVTQKKHTDGPFPGANKKPPSCKAVAKKPFNKNAV